MKDRTMMGFGRKFSRALLCSAVVAAAGAGLFDAQMAFADKGDLQSVSTADKSHRTQAPMQITLGKAEIVNLPDNVSDVLVANPSIVDVQAVQSNKLYVVGVKVGDTNIIVLDAQGNVVKKMDVHVTYDLQAIQSKVEALFPNDTVNVSSVHDQIVLTGTASTPENASKISNLVTHYVGDLQELKGSSDELVSNLMEVHGEQQVMLQVKVLEAKRSVIKELGVDTRANDPDELSVSTIFGNKPPGSVTGDMNALGFGAASGLTLSQDAIATGSMLLDSGIKGIGQIGFFLNALEEQNLIHVLAEPNLTAVSGQQAGFLAGGEFPVPTGRDQFGNITIEFREFGVSLNFKPVVLSNDRINLQLNTEVSSLNETNSVTLADLEVPGLDIRRADTTVEIPSGGSLMIAGLLQAEAAKSLSGVPGIKDTPVLGKLISSDGFQRDETEMVVIVTAYTVEPFANKTKATQAPVQKETPLSKVFANNVRRVRPSTDENLFANGGYGYLLD